MRAALLLIASVIVPLCAAAESPDVAVTGDWSTGNGYRAWDGKGKLDWGDRPDWSANGSFAWSHSHGASESLSKQFTVGFEHTPDDNWSYRGTFTGWRDYISNTRYFGPSWGVTYLINKKEAEAPPKAPDADGSSAASGRNENAPPQELMGFLFDNDFFFFHSPQTSQTTIIRRKNKPAEILPPGLSSENIAQWHPAFTFEMPLFHETVAPSFEGGHYFYSGDPGVVEARANAPRFSAAAGSLSSLASGLFKNDVSAMLDVKLPWHFRLHGMLAGSQSATDNTWAITQELSLKTTVAGRVSAKGKWDHTIQAGQGTDQYTVGLTLLF